MCACVLCTWACEFECVCVCVCVCVYVCVGMCVCVCVCVCVCQTHNTPTFLEYVCITNIFLQQFYFIIIVQAANTFHVHYIFASGRRLPTARNRSDHHMSTPITIRQQRSGDSWELPKLAAWAFVIITFYSKLVFRLCGFLYVLGLCSACSVMAFKSRLGVFGLHLRMLRSDLHIESLLGQTRADPFLDIVWYGI